ncbi:MAG: hypothetical protein J7J31_00335 [Helicobacteraceae bacterium]|nr:hypothetical protein [Helicobacteraceae bacterium]
MKPIWYFSVALCALFLVACNDSDSNSSKPPITDEDNTLTQNPSTLKNVSEYHERMHVYKPTSNFDLGSSQKMENHEAVVTSMCYTKHEQQYNPCYVCHQDKKEDGRANYMHDGELQNEYAFSDIGMTNQWDNLFIDRTEKIAQISDEQISEYINTQNYTDLKPMLLDNNFSGYIPDLANYHLGADAFNADGFAKDGSGWVAFNYKPLPSTFWPVNGSTDDVLIRLDKPFRQNSNGEMSVSAYKFNLAIVEATIKNLEQISVDDLDENSVGVDLNGDGTLGVVQEINRPHFYVGGANNVPVETFLYPQYTEFLHTVRYIGSTEGGEIYNAPRMKELRYMIKNKSYHESSPLDKMELSILYDLEWQEKSKGWLPQYSSLLEKGIDNNYGWWLQGFIEDANGELRPQTYEETFFCMGCHTTIGSTIDQTFAFARKPDGAQGWGYIDLRKMVDTPNIGEDEGEILTYFKRVGGGNEFRITNDVHAKFYENGTLNEEKVKAAKNVYELITPTHESALTMNKAYKVLVESQDFIHGRDGNAKPVENVYKQIEPNAPVLPPDKQYKWDIRLDWSQTQRIQ